MNGHGGAELVQRLRQLSQSLLTSCDRVAVSLEANLVLLAIREHQRDVLVTKRQAIDASGVGGVSFCLPHCSVN